MAISDRMVATTAGALVLVLVAAACGGDGASDPAEAGNATNPTANQPDPGTDPGQSSDGVGATTTPGSTTPATDSNAEFTIDPSTLVLAWVEIQVRGIGGGGSYVHYPDPALRQAAEESLEEVLAEGDGYAVVRPIEGEPEVKLVDDGGCLLAQPLKAVTEDGNVTLVSDNVVFEAHVRYSQAEHVTLADNGSNALGGFAKGGVSRDESEQWEIFGVGPLLYSVSSTAHLGYFVVGAQWSGTSIENFSGVEAAGSVEAACVFVAPGNQ